MAAGPAHLPVLARPQQQHDTPLMFLLLVGAGCMEPMHSLYNTTQCEATAGGAAAAGEQQQQESQRVVCIVRWRDYTCTRACPHALTVLCLTLPGHR